MIKWSLESPAYCSRKLIKPLNLQFSSEETLVMDRLLRLKWRECWRIFPVALEGERYQNNYYLDSHHQRHLLLKSWKRAIEVVAAIHRLARGNNYYKTTTNSCWWVRLVADVVLGSPIKAWIMAWSQVQVRSWTCLAIAEAVKVIVLFGNRRPEKWSRFAIKPRFREWNFGWHSTQATTATVIQKSIHQTTFGARGDLVIEIAASRCNYLVQQKKF